MRDGHDQLIRYIDLSSVEQDTKAIRPNRPIVAREAPSRARQLVQSGDVLVSTVRPNLNGVAMVDTSLDGATASTGFCVLRLNKEKLDGAYLFHWVKTPEFILDMVRKATGASYPAVSDRIVLESKIPLPPIAEQKQIAAILDKAEELRGLRRRALSQLDAIAQSIFLEMFGDPVTNPKGWLKVNLGSIGVVQGGLQVSPSRANLPCKVPYLRVANVYRDALDLSEIKTMCATESEIVRTLLKPDDLLIVEGHGNPNEIGRCALWDGSIPKCIHQNHLIRLRSDLTQVHPVFVSRYLNSAGGRRDLLQAGKTTSGLNTVNVSNVRAVQLLLPPIALQQEFAHWVEAIAQLKITHRESLAQLDALFSSLQHRAFRGEL